MRSITKFLHLFIVLTTLPGYVSLRGQDPLSVDLSAYRSQPGLTATAVDDTLSLSWRGAEEAELNLRFVLQNGVPTIARLSIKPTGGYSQTIATNLQPEYRIVSGLRRVTQQQTEPLEEMGVPLTAEKLDEIKWEAFWDAPLYLDDKPPLSHGGSIPAAEAFANHPGMPRRLDEIRRATAVYSVTSCRVRTNGARLEISFPGVKAGIFAGTLRYDVYRGTNLIRQTLIAATIATSVAFKYDAGLTGLPATGARLIWNDLTQRPQELPLSDRVDQNPIRLKVANRILAVQTPTGSLAAFPPPHRFYWTRESEEVLEYGWYRQHDHLFSFGIRQAEVEDDPEFYHNFALYSARPNTDQQMPVFFYVDPGNGQEATDRALAFTNKDYFRPLPGHKVMGHHYHAGLVKRVRAAGGLEQRINDVTTMKGIGVNIYGVIDGARGPGRKDKGELYLQDLHDYYEAARLQSDAEFLLMPSDENSTGGRAPFLGGHYDILPSKPIYWRPARLPGQPLSEPHDKYGTVYNLGTPADMLAMTELENVLISLPHPGAKRSTGFPEAIIDSAHFRHPNYFGLGYRWGMGIDASEIRLGEYRFLRMWDETNNALTAAGYAPKFALAISEARSDIGSRGKPPYGRRYVRHVPRQLPEDRLRTYGR